ncbi:MAG: hypothetical protein ACYCY5_03920 [Sulfuricella sp.]
MAWTKRLLVILAVLLAVIGLPFLIPLNTYIPEVEKRAGMSVPLRVSGTLQNPVLFPTGAEVTGAVVGTAILGPGVGTSLGVQAADKLDSWFGGKKK